MLKREIQKVLNILLVLTTSISCNEKHTIEGEWLNIAYTEYSPGIAYSFAQDGIAEIQSLDNKTVLKKWEIRNEQLYIQDVGDTFVKYQLEYKSQDTLQLISLEHEMTLVKKKLLERMAPDSQINIKESFFVNKLWCLKVEGTNKNGTKVKKESFIEFISDSLMLSFVNDSQKLNFNTIDSWHLNAGSNENTIKLKGSFDNNLIITKTNDSLISGNFFTVYNNGALVSEFPGKFELKHIENSEKIDSLKRLLLGVWVTNNKTVSKVLPLKIGFQDEHGMLSTRVPFNTKPNYFSFLNIEVSNTGCCFYPQHAPRDKSKVIEILKVTESALYLQSQAEDGSMVEYRYVKQSNQVREEDFY